MISIIYYVFIPTYLFKGQTLGKKICKIKIIKENNESINLKDMMLRELLGASLLEGGNDYHPNLYKKATSII